MWSGYYDKEIRVILNAMMYGSPAEEKSKDSGWSVDLERQFYLEHQTGGTPVITEDSGDRFISRTAYFVKENVLYRVSAIGEPNTQDEVQETLERVLVDFNEDNKS